jgi:hypothetical protein
VACHLLAADPDRALSGLDDPADRVQERALAGAVRADERDALALVEVERDAVDGDRGAVLDDERVDLEQLAQSSALPR